MRNTRNKKTKMKGGYVHFVDGEWKTNALKSDGTRRSDIAIDYSNSEASFLNKLGVPRVNIDDWFSDPTNANVYLEILASDILGDVPEDIFNAGLLRIKNAIYSLKEAYSKREASDAEIDAMEPEMRAELGITSQDQERHKEFTFKMKMMLESIKIFMKPYEEKEERLKPKVSKEKGEKVEKVKVNPFLFFRTHELSETESKGAEEPTVAQTREEPTEPKGAKKKKEKEKKKKEFDISTKFNVSTFNYTGECLEPTSLCFGENKMIIFSKDLITLLIYDPTNFVISTLQNRTSNLDISFCDSRGDDIVVTFGNKLYRIQINENKITTFEMVDSSFEYKGVNFSDTHVYCVGPKDLYRLSPINRSVESFGLPLRLTNPMGIRLGSEFLVIADSGRHRIIIVHFRTLGTNTYDIIGGDTPGFKNGKTPKFNNPMDVLILPDNSIVVSDTGNHSIRRIYKIDDEWTTETIAGNGTPGLKDGIGNDAMFNEPHGLRFFINSIYVADKKNNLIRIIQYVGI